MPRISGPCLQATAVGLELPASASFDDVAECLAVYIRGKIYGPLRDIGQLAFGLAQHEIQLWLGQVNTGGEARDLSYPLALTLLNCPAPKAPHAPVCNCWDRWADFGIASEAAATTRCLSFHSLQAWYDRAPRPALKPWVRNVVVASGAKKCNSFRKAMLPCLVACPRTGALLQIAPVAVCKGCGRELTLDNCCNCNTLPQAEPTYRMFRKGDREIRVLRRCKNKSCKRCFFGPPTMTCINCKECKGYGEIRVWTPVAWNYL